MKNKNAPTEGMSMMIGIPLRNGCRLFAAAIMLSMLSAAPVMAAERDAGVSSDTMARSRSCR